MGEAGEPLCTAGTAAADLADLIGTPWGRRFCQGSGGLGDQNPRQFVTEKPPTPYRQRGISPDMSRVPELASLRAELRVAGLFEHHEGRSWLKLLVLMSGVALCLTGVALHGWLPALLLIPLASVLATAAAMLGHEGSHKSFSPSPTRNTLLTHLVFPAFAGLSALYWREKHDRLHHGHPNVEGLDPDIRPWPFASSKGDHLRGGGKLQWFQRTCQRWAFWPLTSQMAVGMRRASFIHLAAHARKHGRDRAWWFDVTSQVIHYVSWLVVPTIVFGPLPTLAVYLTMWSGVGLLLALIFAPAHMGLPIMAEQRHDWVHQLETTRNLELPRFVSFFFIGLDYQVEHHLFPKIPHKHLPRAAAITAAWCAKNGLVHLSEPYMHALKDASGFIGDAWQHDAHSPIAVRAGLVGHQLAA